MILKEIFSICKKLSRTYLFLYLGHFKFYVTKIADPRLQLFAVPFRYGHSSYQEHENIILLFHVSLIRKYFVYWAYFALGTWFLSLKMSNLIWTSYKYRKTLGNMTIKTEVYFVLQRFFWFPLCFVFMKNFMNHMLFCIFFKYLLEGMSRINKHLRSLCSKNKTIVK